MLFGIDPLLSGDLLRHLDHMGHSDLVVITDAHFPAFRLGRAVVEVAADAPRVTRAIRTVLTLDDLDPVTLMRSGETWNAAQEEIIAAADVAEGAARAVDRFEFYEIAASAQLVVRCAETRTFANAILSKGVIPAYADALGR